MDRISNISQRVASAHIQAGLAEVVEKIFHRIRDSELAQRMIEKVRKYWQTGNPADDLTPSETSMIYRPDDYGEMVPLSNRKKLDVEWSNHAEYRSDLRDVSPEKVNKAIEERLKGKLPHPDRNKVKLKEPGLGTIVLDYNMMGQPASADVITVWASERESRIAVELLRCAKDIISTRAEKEVEKLLGVLLRGSPFAGKVYAVGGYVRDELLGLEPKDLDVVVELKDGAEKLAEYVHGLFPAETSTPRRMGAGYPIWQVAFKGDIEFKDEIYETFGAVVEFVDTQKESFPDPESRQRVVEHGTLGEDVERRDFTVNMLLKDLTTGEVKDLTGTSVDDLKKGILRGHPGVNFDKILSDDPLRMIRLVRFQVKYGWDVPMSVLKAVKRNAQRIAIISGERIRDELIKIMNIGKMGQAIRIMKAIGLLKYILPEIDKMKGVEHEYSLGRHQEGDVYKHTLMVLQNAKPGVENQLAALLHDVGKPETQQTVEGIIRFIGHEKAGGEMAAAIMKRLKFDSETVNRVKTMVENHMRPHFLVREDTGPKALRKFIREVGQELVGAVLDLAEADQLGQMPPDNMIPDLRKDIEIVMAPVAQAEKLPINGIDVQRILNIRPSKQVGDILIWLKDENYNWELAGKKMTSEDAERLVIQKFGKS